jgi:3-phosphoshikimate 1-carboxyvinyltransferase
VSGGESILPLNVDVDGAPDAALPLAALLSFSSRPSILRGVARLRDKESDRLSAAVDLVTRCGGLAIEVQDAEGRATLRLSGGREALHRADFAAHGDHRVAMSAAVMALGLPDGSTLDDPSVVAKSYPRFFEEWRRLVS